MSSNAKHTPGPWYVGGPNQYDHNTSHIGVRSDEWVVCEVQTDVEDLPGEANARLIAAAPDLLEALQSVRNAVIKVSTDRDGSWAAVDQGAMEKVRAAIAKATGSEA